MRAALAFSVGFLALMAVVSLWGYAAIPGGAQVPMHWDASGEVDRYGGKAETLLAMPLLAVFVVVVLALSRRYGRLQGPSSARAFDAVWFAALLLLLGLHAFLVWNGARGGEAEPIFVLYGACALLVVVGNVLGKTRRNAVIGVRTPWSLSSEDAWIASNRAAGWGMAATGLLGAAALAFGSVAVSVLIILAGNAASFAVSILIAWQTAKRNPARTD